MSESTKRFKLFDYRWKDALGDPACPYAVRWVFLVNDYGIRLHKWLASDDQRHMHDHPWWMLIIMLKGAYYDVTPEGRELVKAPTVRFRPADHKHSVEIIKPPTWTLVLTGKKTRNWGFWVGTRNKIMRPLRYFSRYKYPPCQD